jgi:hypothetical protein
MKWERCGRKQSQRNLRHCLAVCLEELTKSHKNLAGIVSNANEFQITYKSEILLHNPTCFVIGSIENR